MNACWAPEEKRQLHKHTQETVSGPGFSVFSVFIQQRITEYWLFFSFPISKSDVGNRAKNKSVMVLAHQEFIGWPRRHVQLSSGFALAMTIGNCTIDSSCSLCLLDMPFALWLGSSSSAKMDLLPYSTFGGLGHVTCFDEWNLAQSDSESTASFILKRYRLVPLISRGTSKVCHEKNMLHVPWLSQKKEKHMQHNWTELGAKPYLWSRTEPEHANPEKQLTSAEPSSWLSNVWVRNKY